MADLDWRYGGHILATWGGGSAHIPSDFSNVAIVASDEDQRFGHHERHSQQTRLMPSAPLAGASVAAKKPRSSHMKTFEHEWILDAWVGQPSFFTKRMFGGLAAYLFERQMLVLVQPTKSGRWTWHGALVC